MIDGSYKICCNPMLLGVLVYYGGIVVCLHTWQAAAIFAAFHIVMGNRQPRRKRKDHTQADSVCVVIVL